MTEYIILPIFCVPCFEIVIGDRNLRLFLMLGLWANLRRSSVVKRCSVQICLVNTFVVIKIWEKKERSSWRNHYILYRIVFNRNNLLENLHFDTDTYIPMYQFRYIKMQPKKQYFSVRDFGK